MLAGDAGAANMSRGQPAASAALRGKLDSLLYAYTGLGNSTGSRVHKALHVHASKH